MSEEIKRLQFVIAQIELLGAWKMAQYLRSIMREMIQNDTSQLN